MEEIFLKHKEWIDSQGQKGTQLFLDEKDMAYANIDGKIVSCKGIYSDC